MARIEPRQGTNSNCERAEGADRKENGEAPEDAAVDEREAEPEPAGVSG